MTEPVTRRELPAPAAGVLDQARQSRERISRQLGQIQAARPARGAEPTVQARWLLEKAEVHDRIAGYLRGLGDIPGAVEAEVLASRCRLDARDLAQATGHRGGAAEAGRNRLCLSPARPTAARLPVGPSTCRGAIAVPDDSHLRGIRGRGLDEVLVTCGPGLP